MSQETPTWYVYSAKGREGPLSLAAILDLIARGEVSTEDYAWCPGMADWKRIKELEALQPSSSSSIPFVSGEGTASSLVFVSALDMANPSPQQDPDTANIDLDSLRKARRTPKLELDFGSQIIRAEPAPQEVLNQAPAAAPTPEPIPATAVVEAQPVAIATPVVQVQTSAPRPISTESPTQSTTRFNRFWVDQKQTLKLAAISLSLCGVFYVGLTQVDREMLLPSTLFERWFSSFPKITDVSEEDYVVMKAAASASLRDQGPRLELVLSSAGQKTAIYLASNLPNETSFELHLKALPATLVGDPKTSGPIVMSLAKRVARSEDLDLVPGYYWVHVLPGLTLSDDARSQMTQLTEASGSPFLGELPQGRRPLIAKRLFLGGTPDLGYQTHLKDYHAVRRGKAQVELDTLKELVLKMKALLLADNQAAQGLLGLKIQKAKEQAWDIFHPTWSKQYTEVEVLSGAPVRFFSETHRSFAKILDLLKNLHEKHHALAVPGATSSAKPGSSPQLSPSLIASAQVQAEAQSISQQISTLLDESTSRLESAAKRLSESQGFVEEEKR